jgi:hypothetical protein
LPGCVVPVGCANRGNLFVGPKERHHSGKAIVGEDCEGTGSIG